MNKFRINQINGEKYQYGPASFKGYPVVDMCTYIYVETVTG